MKLPPLCTPPPTRHAGEGRHPGDGGGMDTGFRRYDGSLMPIRRPDGTCACIFERDTKVPKVSDNHQFELRAIRALLRK